MQDFVDDRYEGIQRKQIECVILKKLQMTSDSYVDDPIERNICKSKKVDYKLEAFGPNHIMGSDIVNNSQPIPQNVSKVMPKHSNFDNDSMVIGGFVHGKNDEVARDLEENDVTSATYKEKLYATTSSKDGANTQGCVDANTRLSKPQTFRGDITTLIQESLKKEIKDNEPTILEGVKVLTPKEDVKRIDAKMPTTSEPNVHKQTTHEILNIVVDGNMCQHQTIDNNKKPQYVMCANQDDNHREATVTSPDKSLDIFEKHNEFPTVGGFKKQPNIDILDKDMQHEHAKDRLGRRKKWSTNVELLKDANLCCLQYANKDDNDEQGEEDEDNVKARCDILQDLQTQLVFMNTTMSSNLQNNINEDTQQVFYESTSRRNKKSSKMCDMDCDSDKDGLSIPKWTMYEQHKELLSESHHNPIAQLEGKIKDVEGKEDNSMSYGSALSKEHANLEGESMLQVTQKEPTMDKKIVINTNMFIKHNKIDQRHVNESKRHEIHFGFKKINEVCDMTRSRPIPLMTVVGGSGTHKICERQVLQQLESHAYSRNMHDRQTALYEMDDDESKIYIDECTPEGTHVILDDKHLSLQVAKQGTLWFCDEN